MCEIYLYEFYKHPIWGLCTQDFANMLLLVEITVVCTCPLLMCACAYVCSPFSTLWADCCSSQQNWEPTPKPGVLRGISCRACGSGCPQLWNYLWGQIFPKYFLLFPLLVSHYYFPFGEISQNRRCQHLRKWKIEAPALLGSVSIWPESTEAAMWSEGVIGYSAHRLIPTYWWHTPASTQLSHTHCFL